MKGIRDLSQITAKINSGFSKELLHIAERDNNKYIDLLLCELALPEVSTMKLFRYGMDNLPENTMRPNMELSTFFLVLSEIKGLPPDASSFAVDLMVYCENDPDGPDSIRPDLIQSEYQRIKPMLA
jgi:hypothetical protein